MKNHPYRDPEKYKHKDELVLLPENTDTSAKVDISFLREYIRYAREKCHP